jgi:pimeloyl-ACP methyl ester carboxylesterase
MCLHYVYAPFREDEMTTNATPESKFLEVNGLRLHYLDWGNQSAPPLVCVHGFRGNAHSFDGFARRFRDRYRVIAVDVRGRGDSAWASDGDYSMAAYTRDLAGIVDALGLDRFSYIGTSMGGRIGMLYAAEHAGRLERFILNDIGPDRESGSDRITAEAGRTPDDFASLEDVIAYRASISSPLARRSAEEQREAALTQVRQADNGRWVWKHDPAFLRQRASGGAQSQPELWDVLRRLQAPTLLLWGAESDVLSEGQARRIIEALPNGTLAEIPGVGHAPTLSEAEAVAALETFLSTKVPV